AQSVESNSPAYVTTPDMFPVSGSIEIPEGRLSAPNKVGPPDAVIAFEITPSSTPVIKSGPLMTGTPDPMDKSKTWLSELHVVKAVINGKNPPVSVGMPEIIAL